MYLFIRNMRVTFYQKHPLRYLSLGGNCWVDSSFDSFENMQSEYSGITVICLEWV